MLEDAMMGQINHLVVLMMENPSFDHVLGALALEGRTDINGIMDPMATDPAPKGRRGASMVRGRGRLRL
jgi:phospholipase C